MNYSSQNDLVLTVYYVMNITVLRILHLDIFLVSLSSSVMLLVEAYSALLANMPTLMWEPGLLLHDSAQEHILKKDLAHVLKLMVERI